MFRVKVTLSTLMHVGSSKRIVCSCFTSGSHFSLGLAVKKKVPFIQSSGRSPTGRRFKQTQQRKLTQQQALPLTRYLQKIFVLVHLGSHPETDGILAELEKRWNGPGLRCGIFHSNRGFHRPLAGQQWQHHPGDPHW